MRTKRAAVAMLLMAVMAAFLWSDVTARAAESRRAKAACEDCFHFEGVLIIEYQNPVTLEEYYGETPVEGYTEDFHTYVVTAQ